MSEDAFRIAVAAAVAVAALAFVVHYCIVIALYRDVEKIQKRVAQFAGEVKPVLASVGPIMEHINPMIHRMGLVIEQFAPALEKSRPAIQRTRRMIGKVGQLVDEVGLVLAAADRIIQETRPRITEITMETVAVGKSAREQMERLGDLVPIANIKLNETMEFASPSSTFPLGAQHASRVGRRRLGGL